MYVSVYHNITDPQRWAQVTQNIKGMIEQNRLPAGLKGLCYMPGLDGRKAACVWEAESVEQLRSFLDRQTGTAARNEYFAINAETAVGLPGQEQLRKAA